VFSSLAFLAASISSKRFFLFASMAAFKSARFLSFSARCSSIFFFKASLLAFLSAFFASSAAVASFVPLFRFSLVSSTFCFHRILFKTSSLISYYLFD